MHGRLFELAIRQHECGRKDIPERQAKILERARSGPCCSSDVTTLLRVIRDLQEKFGDWYEHLPDAVQLMRLGDDTQTPLQSSIYYVHLLHLGAVMLMFRHCLAGLQFPVDRESLSSEQRSTMHAALDDGLQAAQQSARMTYLTRKFSPSVRYCWTMMCVLWTRTNE